MADLFTVTAPLMIRCPNGEKRVMAALFRHAEGLLYFDLFWDRQDDGQGVHLVAGDIRGNEKVVISKSGNVRGNIIAPRMTLEDGAIFKGSIDMDPGDAAAKVSLAPKTGAGKPALDTDSAPELDLKSG